MIEMFSLQKNVYALFFITSVVISDNFSSVITRQERIFPFIIFPYYRVKTVVPSRCATIIGEEGICYPNAKCNGLNLVPASTCSSGAGVCCIAIKTCGENSSSLVTYFRSSQIIPSRCTLTITKANSTITQLRLDFISFNLPEPENGRCANFLQLSPTDSTLPKLCGLNTGSHVYIDFDPQCQDHTLQFSFINPSGSDWNIKVTQISYLSDKEAPRGCLMYYYNNVSGIVSSFNFGDAKSGSRQLSPLNYAVCIRPLTGFCKIMWTQVLFNLDPVATGCATNYVVIPGSTIANQQTNTDRYCGNVFPNPTTSSKPFILYVVTTGVDVDASPGSRGFRLQFQQIPCQ